MDKLIKDLRVGTLGAAAGLFSSSVTLLVARIDSYYHYLSLRSETDYGSYHAVDGLLWMPAFVWHLLLSVVATLLVHRYLTIRPRSTFLLWQVIGLASLVGWVFTAFLVIGLDCVMNGNLNTLQRAANSDEIATIAKYVSTVFACNVFYGCVMHFSSQQYTEEFVSVDDAARSL